MTEIEVKEPINVGLLIGILLIVVGVGCKIGLDSYSASRIQDVYQRAFVAISNNPENGKQRAFIIVIGVIAVIIFASTMFMSGTIEESRQTSMSIRGLHATSLAEASLERAMRILSEKINQVDPDKASKDDLGIKLRLPASEGSSTMGQSENFGADKQLNLSDDIKKEMVLTKDDLQPNGEKELDELVDFMTDKGAKSYEVTVKAKVSQAFRNSPGKSYEDYKVPGVDIEWNVRYDVKNFLAGDGYSALEIKLPSGMKWLKFSIPIKIGSIKLIDINVGNIIGKLLPDVNIGGKEYSFEDFTSFDTLADLLLNQLIAKGAKKVYPIEVRTHGQSPADQDGRRLHHDWQRS